MQVNIEVKYILKMYKYLQGNINEEIKRLFYIDISRNSGN